MTDRRITVAYTLHHPSAEPDAIRGLVESLRRSAINLGFVRVGDVVSLIGDGEIISSDFGERFLVPDLEIVPAVPRTRDLRTFSKLLCFAAEVGIWASMSFAGISMVYSPDESGKVSIQQEWDVIPDDF